MNNVFIFNFKNGIIATMKPIFGAFFACTVLPQIAFGVDFPTVAQSVAGGQSTTDLNFVEFPKPKSETDLDFVDFPKPEPDVAPLETIPFPETTEKLLQATQFPKTIQDLSFKSRMDLLADGYAPYEIVYQNGVCVSGCAYPGITLAEDMAAVDEATEEMADLLEEAEEEQEEVATPTDWCHNGLSTKLPLRYPVDMTNFKYKIVSDFGYRQQSDNGARFHPAIDIGCPTGTPVYATADGIARVRGSATDQAGYYVNIEHENGLETQYLHLSRILVTDGQHVKACDKIALSGVSGNNINGKPYTGPHLDYRIHFSNARNKYVDILCPCKLSTKEGDGQTSNYDMSCAHSLFHAPYKFKKYNPNNDAIKRSLWRVKHGHCMQRNTDLLPDETAP